MKRLFYSFHAHFNDFSRTFELRFLALKKMSLLNSYFKKRVKKGFFLSDHKGQTPNQMRFQG